MALEKTNNSDWERISDYFPQRELRDQRKTEYHEQY